MPYSNPFDGESIESIAPNILAVWNKNPRLFCRDVLKIDLDDFQGEFLDSYRTNPRVAMIASKGVGKTFTLAVAVAHFMTTFYRPKGCIVSISRDHLKTNLWAETVKLITTTPFLNNSLDCTSERISWKGPAGKYAFMEARSVPKTADKTQQASALAGVHADNVLFAIDEGGMLPDAVLETADAVLANDVKGGFAAVISAGNPEIASGMIYRAAKGKSEKKWKTIFVSGDPEDPKRAKRVNIEWAKETIKEYGRDDPWVQINILGQYPTHALNTLLSEEEAMAAANRTVDVRDLRNVPARLGVDVSRDGEDRNVFICRKGQQAYDMQLESSGLDGKEIAEIIDVKDKKENFEKVFIDDTGGYGSTVVDHVKHGYPHITTRPIKFQTRAHEKLRYLNKRTEMWVRMRDWIRDGGCIPNDRELIEELAMPRTIIKEGKIRLEPKEDIKKRLGRSPDRADALALTFADLDIYDPDAMRKPDVRLGPDLIERDYDKYNDFTLSKSDVDYINRGSRNTNRNYEA